MTRYLSEALRNSKPKIVVVMPTLNEENGIGPVIDGVLKVMKPHDCSVLVVDGHSEDRTAQIAKDLGASVVLQRQIGYGDALKTGFECACKEMQADILVMMDADGTYDPQDVSRLLIPVFENSADLVIGDRFRGMKPKSMTFINRIGNRILSRVARWTLEVSVNDTQCGLRVLNSDLARHLTPTSNGMSFATEMLAEARQAQARIIEMPVSYYPRIGKTKLSPIRDGLRILGAILRLIRNYRPLLFFGVVGFSFMVLGAVLGVGVVFEWMATGTIGHLASVALSSLLILTGIFVSMIGLLADMIKELRRELRTKLM